MIPRVVTVLVLMDLLYVLLHASVTVPALSLIGLVLWALAASVLAAVLAWRQRTSPSDRAAQQRPPGRKTSRWLATRRYRAPSATTTGSGSSRTPAGPTPTGTA